MKGYSLHYGTAFCDGPSGYKDLPTEDFEAEKKKLEKYTETV